MSRRKQNRRPQHANKPGPLAAGAAGVSEKLQARVTAESGSTVKAHRAMAWLVAVPAVAIMSALWFALSCYPETEKMIEHINFFVSTPDFLSAQIAAIPSLTTLLTSWLQQFFANPSVGIAIETLLLGALTLLAALVPRAWGHRASPLFALIPAVGLPWLFLHRPSLSIEGIYFFGSLVALGYVCRKLRPWLTSVATILAGLLSFWFLAFPVAVLLVVAVSILRQTQEPKACQVAGVFNAVLPLLLIVALVVCVKVSSAKLGFIPFNQRLWFVPESEGRVVAVLLLFAAPVLPTFIPLKGKKITRIVATLVLSIAAAVYTYSHITSNQAYRDSEQVYRYADLAERGQWQQLLNEVNSAGAISNNVHLQYALLAEARLGTLPDNLFFYPINSPETFCPRLDKTPLSTDFCRIFYRELGFPDEAFHQAFQYGMMVSRTSGFCAASLRHMAEYSVETGDRPLAEKYLYLLEHTSNNSKTVAALRASLNTSSSPLYSPPQGGGGGGLGGGSGLPLRADNFAKAYAFNSEMAHFLDYDHSNRAALDYLLCGLLLTKQLEIFKTVINEFTDTYKDRQLPRAYAEAAAMIRHLSPDALSPYLHYPPQYDRQFEQFVQLHNSRQDDTAFRGTFWYYYTYAQIPPMQEWISQSQSS